MDPVQVLPRTAQVVAEVIGSDSTLKLAHTCGRFRSFYVPKQLREGHWLRSVVGDEAAEALVAEFQGMQLPLAKCSRVAKAMRNDRIARMKRAGASASEIGRVLEMPASSVRTVLQRQRLRGCGSV